MAAEWQLDQAHLTGNPVRRGFRFFAADDHPDAGRSPGRFSLRGSPMSTFRTVPAFQTGGRRAFLLAIGIAAALASAITPASDVLVVTDGQHPVKVSSAVRVIELDAPERLVESELAAHLPANPEQAAAIAQQRLQDGGAMLQKRLALAYQGVVESWSLGITKIPAVVVDRKFVVYGEPDVNRAVSLIEQYGSTQP